MQFLFVFAQAHADFRIPELESISELYGFPVTLPDPALLDATSPFMVAELQETEHAVLLASRCILIKSIYELYARGTTYEEMHQRNRENMHKWSVYAQDTSFKFFVKAFNYTLPQSRQRDIIESFSYMMMLGKIEMKNPEITFGCLENYDDLRGTLLHHQRRERTPKEIFFGQLVAEGSARNFIHTFDVKKRAYYGNTSMDAEISLLMANQTLASSGKFIYDPFMGTGSTAYPIAYFGALVFGSDIDGRQMRGKGKPPGIIRAAAQYGVAHRIVDLCTFDITQNPWRCGALFDAIVTDPPYGVRAGAKRLGRKRERPPGQQPRPPRPDDLPYIPPKKPYELSVLVRDLVLLSRHLLKPHGRLVFFLPTVADEYSDVDVETVACEGMEVVANSLQDFGSWGRRLVTIKKTTTKEYPMPTFDCEEEEGEDQHAPAHQNFREKYFQGFKAGADATS